MTSSGEQSGANGEAWEQVLTLLWRLQSLLLAGGTAAALYVGHRFSFDHDHVMPNLPERFDIVLAEWRHPPDGRRRVSSARFQSWGHWTEFKRVSGNCDGRGRWKQRSCRWASMA